jgi:DNA-directed RNA polymerase subunit M/transcription elongation factor TFIIS
MPSRNRLRGDQPAPIVECPECNNIMDVKKVEPSSGANLLEIAYECSACGAETKRQVRMPRNR